MNSQLPHDDCWRIRSTIWKLAKRLCLWLCVCFCVCLTTRILIDTDNFFNSDDIMTSLLKKLSIFIKIGVIKRYGVCMVSFKIVDQIRRQSSSASCELCSQLHTADADATKQFRRVGSAVCTHRTPPTRRNSTVSSRRRCVLGLKDTIISLLSHLHQAPRPQTQRLI